MSNQPMRMPEGAIAHEVQMGQRVSRYPIDKYRGAKDRRDMITILSANPIVTKTQYHDELGPFHALPEAEKAGLKPSVKYNFVIARWDTNSKGKIQSKDFTVQFLSANDKLYDSLIDKYEINGDLRKLAILIRCTNEDYQYLETDVAGPSPIMQDKELRQRVLKLYKELKDCIPQVIAAVIPWERVQAALGGSSEDFSDLTASQQNLLPSADNASLLSGFDDDGGFDADLPDFPEATPEAPQQIQMGITPDSAAKQATKPSPVEEEAVTEPVAAVDESPQAVAEDADEASFDAEAMFDDFDE